MGTVDNRYHRACEMCYRVNAPCQVETPVIEAELLNRTKDHGEGSHGSTPRDGHNDTGKETAIG